MKKLFSLMISLIMALTMTTSAFADSATQPTGIDVTGPEWDYLTLGEDYYIDDDGDIVFNYEQSETTTITYENPAARMGSYEYITYNPKYKVGSGNVLKFGMNIDCPTSLIFKPKLSMQLVLKTADTKNGSYTTVFTSEWFSVNYATTYWVNYTGTHHYRFTVNVRSEDGGIIEFPSSTFYTCRNRTGHIWDYYHTDPNSGVVIAEPPTNWVVNQQSRPSNLNTTYQDTYNALYGTKIVVGKDVKIDVHHVQPLKYGGSNAMRNLVHIDSDFHTKITGWFAGY